MNVEILVNFVTDNASFSLFCFVQNSLSRDAPIDNCGLLFPTFCKLSCCVLKGTYFVRGLLVPMIFETDYYPIKSYNDAVQNTLEYLRLENISSANYFSTVSREENQKMWHISWSTTIYVCVSCLFFFIMPEAFAALSHHDWAVYRIGPNISRTLNLIIVSGRSDLRILSFLFCPAPSFYLLCQSYVVPM